MRISKIIVFLLITVSLISCSKKRLYDAIVSNDTEAVSVLISKGIDINYTFHEDMTPLMVAAKYGNSKIVRMLLQNEADINKLSEYGWSALMFACWQGHHETVKILTEHNAQLDLTSKYIPPKELFATRFGYSPSSPLEEAVKNGHSEIAIFLIENGASFQNQLFITAASNGDIKLLSFFLSRGADIDFSGTWYANTALIEACSHGHLSTVKWLIENGARINNISHGEWAIKEAALHCRHHVVQYLIDMGANIHLTDKNSDTVLDKIAIKIENSCFEENIAIIESLVKSGTKIHRSSYNRCLRHRNDFIKNAKDKKHDYYKINIEYYNRMIELLKQARHITVEPKKT